MKVINGKEYIKAREASEKTGLSMTMLTNYRRRFAETGELYGPRFIKIGFHSYYDLKSVESYIKAIGA